MNLTEVYRNQWEGEHCAFCGEPIEKGERMREDTDTSEFYHVDCAPDEEE